MAKIFDTVEYLKWRGFRDSEDSRFVSLVMPRVMGRLPYGARTSPIDEFGYEEGADRSDRRAAADESRALLLDEMRPSSWGLV
ncbi:MAG: type VI secretion system contractile sheath large subunit [Aliidongia sp.]